MSYYSQTANGRPGPLFPDSKREAWASIPRQQKGGLGLGLCSQTAKGRLGPVFPDSKKGGLGLYSQTAKGRPGPVFPDSKRKAWACIPRQQKEGLGLCSQTAKGRPGPVFPDSKKGGLGLYSQTAKGRPGPLFPDSKREAWDWACVPRQQKGGLGLGISSRQQKGGLGLYSRTAKGRPGPGPLFPDSKREPGSLTNLVPFNAILFPENKMEARFDQTSSGQRTWGTAIKTSSNSVLLWSCMPVGNWPWGLHL